MYTDGPCEVMHVSGMLTSTLLTLLEHSLDKLPIWQLHYTARMHVTRSGFGVGSSSINDHFRRAIGDRRRQG